MLRARPDGSRRAVVVDGVLGSRTPWGVALDLPAVAPPTALLTSNLPTLSLSGIPTILSLSAGAGFANDRYGTVASALGSRSGTPFGSHVLPVNIDPIITFFAFLGGIPGLFQTTGFAGLALDNSGQGTARVIMGPFNPIPVGALGFEVRFAAYGGNALPCFVSNAVVLPFGP